MLCVQDEDFDTEFFENRKLEIMTFQKTVQELSQHNSSNFNQDKVNAAIRKNEKVKKYLEEIS
jgi:hypothetical protein